MTGSPDALRVTLALRTITVRASILLAILLTLAVPSLAGIPPKGVKFDPQNPADAARLAKVNAAIAYLAANGQAVPGYLLQQLMGKGMIEKDPTLPGNPDQNVGYSRRTCRETELGGGINLDPTWIDRATVVDIASVLLHEMLHYMTHAIAVWLNYDTNHDNHAMWHCMIYWKEYVWLRSIADNPAKPAAERDAARAHADRINGWYDNLFTPWYNLHGGDQLPPPPPGGYHWWNISPLTMPSGINGSYGISGAGRSNVTGIWLDAAGVHSVSIDTGITSVTSIQGYKTRTGVDVVIAVGTSADHATGKIVALTDSNADHIVDTVTVVASGSGLVDPLSSFPLQQPGASSTSMFVLDPSAGTVWKLADADSNDIPDGLGTTFCTTSVCAEVATARSLAGSGPVDSQGNRTGAWNIALSYRVQSTDEVGVGIWEKILYDANNDGVCDGQSTIDDGPAKIEPTVWLGGTVDAAWTVYGHAGDVLQVVAFNAGTGQFDDVRASGLASADGTCSLTLTPALTLSSQYVIRDVTIGAESIPLTVSAPSPQIGGMSPGVGVRAGGETIVISGRYFPTQPVVHFDHYDLAGQLVSTSTLTITSSSSTSITATTPASPVGPVFSLAEVRVGDVTVPGAEDRGWFFAYKLE
jgi:hypothetical protein